MQNGRDAEFPEGLDAVKPEDERYLFLAPPALGELQPIYAVIEHLLHSRPNAVAYIASGSTFRPRFDAFCESLEPSLVSRLVRLDLGTTDDVQDYSRGMLNADAGKRPDLFDSHRHACGDPRPFLDYWETFAAGSEADRLATIERCKEVIARIRPAMIIVDQIYGTPFDAVRSTGLPFIVIAPSHPSFSAANVNPLQAPLAMSGIVWRGALSDILANFRTALCLSYWMLTSAYARATLKIRRWTLGFAWLSLPADAAITPPPGLVDSVIATISCNPPGLHFYPSFDSRIVFTGPCRRLHSYPAPSRPSSSDVSDWLDAAHDTRCLVVFITFGSMFPFNTRDYKSMMEVIRKVHFQHPEVRFLWKLARTSDNVAREALECVRETDWLPSVEEVYQHPAVRIVVHHGGGNTVNEVIWHGKIHLAVPQWSDTFDWAATIEGFGLGLRANKSAPLLNSVEIASQLNRIIGRPELFEERIGYWQRRSREAGGTERAVDIIVDQAKRSSPSYEDYKRSRTV